MNKMCPFKNTNCSADCALYVSPDDMNEVVKNKLASIGIIERDKGMCSLKHASLGITRFIFENSQSRFSR